MKLSILAFNEWILSVQLTPCRTIKYLSILKQPHYLSFLLSLKVQQSV